MIDIEKLKYDLAMNSALAMTLQHFQKGGGGNATEIMLVKFQQAHQALSDEPHAEKLKELSKQIENQNNSL